MRYASTAFFGILFFACISPWVTAFIDLYWFFFSGSTFSGLAYTGTDGFMRMLIMFLVGIPAFFLGHFFWFSLTELEEHIRNRSTDIKIDE